MYLYYYCNLRNGSPSDTIDYEHAKILLGKNVPHILRKHIIREMIEFGLLKKITRQTYKISRLGKDTLNSLGIEIINIAIEQKDKAKEKYWRCKQSF